MHTINLEKYDFRTDLIIEDMVDGLSSKYIISNKYSHKNIIIEESIITKDGALKLNRKDGIYKTISFNDVTDKDNYKNVESVFIEVLKKLLDECNINKEDSCMVVGLGNEKSTPDALGPKTVDSVLVTKHLFALGDVEKCYREVSAFIPNVTGVTGIETASLITSAINTVKPKFLIVIDALKATNIERCNKTIQMSNTGISPGSGVGNNRTEISFNTLGIPVIVIGIPTIVDLVTVVADTFGYIKKHFSYKKDNIGNTKLKLVHESSQNYIDYPDTLSVNEKDEILGVIGNLEVEEIKQLILEVLVPINYNLMVTPKEIDFLIGKFSLLLGNGINKSLHEHFNPTN